MNIKSLASTIAVWAVAMLLIHCARQGSPTGGPKDVTPPKLDSLRSTPNYSLHFKDKRIELRFDEWLSLFNPATELTVSPPLAKRPEMSLKGKSVLVEFDKNEQFRENTTYTLNFGASIKDFHEGNAVKDLRFVFSTGDQIDTLNQTGFVMDAFSGEPVDNISVLLYDIDEDSIIRKEKPYYWGKTNKEGQYNIYNIKAGKYKIVAIEDVNQDLKWSGESEKIAFSDTSIVIAPNKKERPGFLKLFKNESAQRLIDKNANTYGFVKLGFAQNPEGISVQPMEAVPGLRFLREQVLDSIYFRYDLENPIAWKLLAGQDTVSVPALNREEFLKRQHPGFADAAAPSGKKGKSAAPVSTGIKSSTVISDKAAILEMNVPISATDSSKWLLSVADSITVPIAGVHLSALSPRKIELSVKWLSEKQHLLTILPGGITDFFGVQNSDTLRRNIFHSSDKQLSSIKLTITDLQPEKSYYLQLLNGTSVEAEQGFSTISREQTLQFKQLPLAAYTVRLIEDPNGNNKWDSGNYFAKRQPERIVNKKLEALRANFELEAKMSTDEAAGKGKKK